MRFILLCLAVALTFSLELKGEEGLVKFEFDPSKTELFGLVMKG